MRHLMILAAVFITLFTANAEPVDLPVNYLPYTVHKIALDSNDFASFKELAGSIGLDYTRTYGYREWVDAKRLYKIGEAGEYEWMLLSTGGNGESAEDDVRAQKSPVHWETMYYSNIDMTIIFQVANDNDRSFVQLLKLAKGRAPDLHQK